MTVLTRKIESLEHDDPWSTQEKRALSKQDRVFIRHIQINDRVSRQEAKTTYGKSNLEGTMKKLSARTRKSINDRYKHEVFRTRDETKQEFIRPKTKKERENIKKAVKNQAAWKKQVRKDTRLCLQSEKTKRLKRWETIKNQHRSYPDASKYELQHGVMSKASQDYRERHGLKRAYAGRTKNKK